MRLTHIYSPEQCVHCAVKSHTHKIFHGDSFCNEHEQIIFYILCGDKRTDTPTYIKMYLQTSQPTTKNLLILDRETDPRSARVQAIYACLQVVLLQWEIARSDCTHRS